MKVTAFGKFLRRLRIDKELLLKEMATELQVSSAFLSSVELGKKSISEEFEEKIISKYKLDVKEASELRQAANLSQPSVKIDLVGKSADAREMVMCFARSYESLSEVEKDKLMNLLKDK